MRPPGTPEERHPGLDAKIVAGLDRIGEALAVLARRSAEAHDLSVTQLRLLARLAAGPPPNATTGALARELDVTDPTASDALAALRRKGLVERERNPADRRQYDLRLTAAGREVAASVRRWTAPAEMLTARIGRGQAEQLLAGLLDVLGRLCAGGLAETVRACSTCRHLAPAGAAGAAGAGEPPYRCLLFDFPMARSDLRVDCAQHEALPQPAAAPGAA